MINKTKGLGILIVATFLYIGWLSPSTSGLMHQILKPALGQGIAYAVKSQLVSYGSMNTAIASGNKNTTTSDKNLSSNTLQLSANEKKGIYTWANKEGTNPTLNFKQNADNVVQLKNPTDSVHQLIITSAGKQVASSGDIKPGKSGELSFANVNQGETLQYHCLYHPSTMKGTITISS
jgi:ABC-type proline/glycine betaine transport system substrate-binding protein